MDKSSKILITGGQGWIGIKLGEHLAEHGFQNVYSLAGSQSGIDLGDDAVIAWSFDINPDIVVHLATRPPTQENSLHYPASMMYENIFVTSKVMEEARLSGCKKFIMAWDSCCYPEHQILPHKEEDLWEGAPYWNQRYYGNIAKAAMEMNMAYSTQYQDWTGVNLIFPEVYGTGSGFNPRKNKIVESVVTNIATAHKYEYHLPVEGSSKCTRDFINVKDAVRALRYAIEYADEPDTYNASQGQDYHVKKLHDMVSELYGYDPNNILWTEKTLDIKQRTFLDISKIKRELGWSPTTTMEDGLKELVEWHKENLKVTIVDPSSILMS